MMKIFFMVFERAQHTYMDGNEKIFIGEEVHTHDGVGNG